MLGHCAVVFTSAQNRRDQSPILWTLLYLIVNTGPGWPDMATPIRILSCSQHTKYHICTHKHTHTNTHTVAPSALLFLPQQFHSVNVWLAAKPWPLAVLHLAGALILSFFLEPIQRLKWLPFSHGIVAFSPYPPVSALSCSLSINPFLSLSLSVSPFFSCCLSLKSLTLHFYRPHFFSSWVLPRHTKAPVDAESPGACICTPERPATQ